MCILIKGFTTSHIENYLILVKLVTRKMLHETNPYCVFSFFTTFRVVEKTHSSPFLLGVIYHFTTLDHLIVND